MKKKLTLRNLEAPSRNLAEPCETTAFRNRKDPCGTFEEPRRTFTEPCGTFPARTILKKTIAESCRIFAESRGTLRNLPSKGNPSKNHCGTFAEPSRNLAESLRTLAGPSQQEKSSIKSLQNPCRNFVKPQNPAKPTGNSKPATFAELYETFTKSS